MDPKRVQNHIAGLEMAKARLKAATAGAEIRVVGRLVFEGKAEDDDG